MARGVPRSPAAKNPPMHRTGGSRSCMSSSPARPLPGARTALAAVLLLSSGLALAAAGNRGLEDRANAMEARLQAVERASKALVELQQQIEAAREELRRLRGEIDEAKHELEALRQQQRALYADVDRRLLLMENDGGT